MHEAWTYDAVNYSADPSHLMVHSNDVDEFNADPSKLAIAAPKGMGKTFVLRSKSIHLRQQHSGAVFIPRNKPLEEFNQLAHDFSEGSYQQFSSVETWKTLWAT